MVGLGQFGSVHGSVSWVSFVGSWSVSWVGSWVSLGRFMVGLGRFMVSLGKFGLV